MNKHLAVLLLAALHGACTTQPVDTATDQTHLSFARIGGEIDVVYEEIAAAEPSDRVLARRLFESP